MAVGEQEMDNIADGMFIDASTGPFQMTGATAKAVMTFATGYLPPYATMSADELRDAVQENFRLAAALAADRMCQIMAGYKAAGWNPCTPGSLSVVELVGTLYSQGLGRPNATPQANGRGEQIGAWAREAVTYFGLPNCDCDCNQTYLHRADSRARTDARADVQRTWREVKADPKVSVAQAPR